VTKARVGVSGLGHLGSHHARAWKKIDGTTLVGGHDPDPAARARAEKDLGIPTFESLSALLDQVDLISLASPTPDHADGAIEALGRGIHVLVEKPMASRPEDGERMLGAARAAGVVLYVGHVERHNPAVAASLPHLRSPKFIEAHRLAPPVNRGLDVDVILDLMIHDLDLALLATRSRITEIHAVGVPVLTSKIDIANARLVFESGCVANLTASRISRDKVRKIRFFEGSEYLSIDCMNRSVEAYALTPGGPLGGGASVAELLARIRPVPIEVKDLDPLETELRHVLALRDEPHRSWAESATALEALRAAERIGRLTAPLTPQGVAA
jgi:predicted dehydrogenase